jgi:hypothetical protein
LLEPSKELDNFGMIRKSKYLSVHKRSFNTDKVATMLIELRKIAKQSGDKIENAKY